MATIETEREGRVLTVLVDNPPHNFMTREMVEELDALTRSLQRDRSVGAVVITGRPDDLYITHYDVAEILAGVEQVGITVPPWLAGPMLRITGAVRNVPAIRSLAERTPLRGLLELHRIHDIFRRMNRTDKVFIAAINGPATGGGCELSLACDLRYMADKEIPIGLPEMTLGFNPGAGGTQRLPRAVGLSRALAMMLEGRTLRPREAAELGLVDAVVAPERLRAEATEAARRMARRTPESIRSLKRAVYDGATAPLGKGLAAERKWFLASGGTEGSKRGLAAYVDQVEREGPTWADPERIRPWQEGTAAELVDEDAGG